MPTLVPCNKIATKSYLNLAMIHEMGQTVVDDFVVTLFKCSGWTSPVLFAAKKSTHNDIRIVDCSQGKWLNSLK
jgi:hypothetical protein